MLSNDGHHAGSLGPPRMVVIEHTALDVCGYVFDSITYLSTCVGPRFTAIEDTSCGIDVEPGVEELEEKQESSLSNIQWLMLQADRIDKLSRYFKNPGWLADRHFVAHLDHEFDS